MAEKKHIILIVAAGVVTISGAMGAVGLSLPQIATQDHIIAHEVTHDQRYAQIEDQVRQLDHTLTLQQIESNELRTLRLEEEERRAREEGREPAPSITGEIRLLKKRTRSLELRLEKLTD